MDNLNELGRYLKKFSKTSDLAIKRTFVTEPSSERIRDVFDATYPFIGKISTPSNAARITMNLNFGRRLPNVGCCGDCFCGTTESYTSDSLIGFNLYTFNEYVPNSVILYLDGTMATKNVDFIESSPTNKQLEILVPFNIATISYMYSTGNCNEGDICPEDTLACLDFGFFSGLATVFADRFDRPLIDETNSGAHTQGGCGQWAASFDSEGNPLPENIFGGSGTANVDTLATLGGAGRVSGKTFEIIAGIAGATDFSASPTSKEYGVSFIVDMFSTNMMRLQIIGEYQYIDSLSILDFDPLNEAGVNDFVDINVGTEFFNAPKFVRLAQFPTGSWVIRVWEQGADESTAYEFTVTTGNITSPPAGATNLELILPTPYYVSVTCPQLQFIKIGAGLDAGRYGDAGSGYYLDVCNNIPDLGGNPYFDDCSSDSITTGTNGNGLPSYNAFIAWPVIVGDVPPAGSGRVAQVDQVIVGTSTVQGKPTAIKIKGYVSVSFAADVGVGVMFETFTSGTSIPSYNNAKFLGSSAANISITCNADPVPFEFLVPAGDDNARWGVSINNVYGLASTLDFISPPFLSPPSYNMTVNLHNIEIEALNSVECTASDICGLCVDTICPPVIDGFYSENYPSFATPATIDIQRSSLSGSRVGVYQGDGTTFTAIGGGEGQIGFTTDETTGFSAIYIIYESSFDCQGTNDYEVEASFEFNINTLSPTGGYGEISFGGWNDGPSGFIEIGGGVIQDAYISSFGPIPNSITAGNWFTLKCKTDGDNLLTKIFVSDTAEPAWNTHTGALLSNPIQGFYISGGYQFNASPPNFTVTFKNINIGRV